MTQFSISAWDGNAENIDRRMAGAQAMLDRAVLQARTLNARHVVPFASFVWFCHEENAYMNSAIRPVGDVADILRTQTAAQPVVLYPGDRWEIGSAMDSSTAIARYAGDVLSLGSRPALTSGQIDLATLQQAADRFGAYLMKDRSQLRLRLNAVRLNAAHQRRIRPGAPMLGRLAALREVMMMRIRPARIWLTDTETSLEYCLLRGLERVSMPRESCDITLSSGALFFAFKFLWGGETLQINGRFREMYPEGRVPLFDYLGTACAMNRQAGAEARPL